MSGKGVGCKRHTSAHFNQLATPTRNNSSLYTRTHTEILENSGKVSVCIMHRAMEARHAHKALFHMGDARSLAPNSDPHVCKRFRFLRLGGRMHPRVGGRFLSFVNSFAFSDQSPRLFSDWGICNAKRHFRRSSLEEPSRQSVSHDFRIAGPWRRADSRRLAAADSSRLRRGSPQRLADPTARLACGGAGGLR